MDERIPPKSEAHQDDLTHHVGSHHAARWGMRGHSSLTPPTPLPKQPCRPASSSRPQAPPRDGPEILQTPQPNSQTGRTHQVVQRESRRHPETTLGKDTNRDEISLPEDCAPCWPSEGAKGSNTPA